MNHPFNLKQKNNDLLISDLKELVSRERELLTKILHYLREVENRKVYLEKGYPSMFAFVTEELGYSEGQAQRRIQAMRLIKDLPEVEQKIESGELSLTVASQVQGYIQRENKKRKLEKSTKLTQVEKLELVQKLEGTSSRTCERQLAQISPETGIPREKTRILSPDNALIQFVAHKRLLNKLNRLKELTSHQNPEGKYALLIEKMADNLLEKIDPIQRQQRRIKRGKKISRPTIKAPAPAPGPVSGPRRQGDRATASPPSAKLKTLNKNHKSRWRIVTGPSPAPLCGAPSPLGRGEDENLPPTSAVKRYIPPKLKDQIWVRDRGKCQFKNKNTGRVCGATQSIQIDHVYPYAWGGKHKQENLRLLCGRHNRYQAEQWMGR